MPRTGFIHALETLDANIAYLDLHRTVGDVKLYPDQAAGFAVVLVIIDEHRHDVAIHDVDQNIAACNHLEIVPIVRLDIAFQGRVIAQRADDARFLGFADRGDHAAPVDKAATPLFV